MRWLSTLPLRFRSLFRRDRVEQDLRDELQFHIDALTERHVARGLSPEDARRAAQRETYGLEAVKDWARDTWVPCWLHGLGQDFRLAVRTLRATPVVAAVAVLSLALGIGANAAIFSLVNSLLLRALPVLDPQELVVLASGTSPPEHTYSYKTFDQIRQRARSFSSALAIAGPSRLSLGPTGDTADALWVSGDFFSTLGVPPLVGRPLTPDDDTARGGPDGLVAVISYGFWQRRFAGAASVVGTSLTIEHAAVTIVGVTPPEFFGTEVGQVFDLYLAVRTEALIRPAIPYDDDVAWLGIMLRLKPGQSIDAATTALRGVQPLIRTAAAPPRSTTSSITMPEFLNAPLRLEPANRGTSALRQHFRQPLVALLGLVGLVLLIASANLANLQLARGAARQPELRIRVALGAGHWRLIRQLLVESILLLAMGGTLGLMTAGAIGRALIAQMSTSETPLFLDLSLAPRVIAFTFGVMGVTGVLFGLVPAWRATRALPIEGLRAHGRGSMDTSQGRVFDSLLVSQVAVSLLLVVAAGLLVRTFQRLAATPLGFDVDQVMTVKVIAPTVSAGDRNPFYHQLVHAAALVPGVAQAAGSRNPPLTMMYAPVSLAVRGVGSGTIDLPANIIEVTPGWFATYGIPILAGRDIDAHDTKDALPVALVNDAFVQRFGSNASVLGSTLTLVVHDPTYGDVRWGSRLVAGIVGDAVYRDIRESHQPALFYPLAQVDGPLQLYAYFMAVRSAGAEPARLITPVAAALHAVNPDLRLTFSPLKTQVGESLAQDRLVAELSGFFGMVALLLAALGLYGTTAYTVTRRRTELGIRMALGATPWSIVQSALARVWILVGIGIVAGTAISLWLSRLAASLVYGLGPHDPATMVEAIAVLCGITALAGGIPAWRASRIDPAAVLREQ